MKRNFILLLLLILNSSIALSQEYALWLSGEGAHDIFVQTSQAPYRNIRSIYWESLTPPYIPATSEAIRDTGIQDLIANASFPINSRYTLRYTPNFNGVFVTINGSFNLNKFQSIFIGGEPEAAFSNGSNHINHYTAYNSPINIFQWAVILPKYVQPSIANRERNVSDQLFLSPENTFSDSSVNVSYVKWQYQVNGSIWLWNDFPVNIMNKFPMNSTIEEILIDELTPIADVNNLRVRIVLSPPQSAAKNIFGGYDYTYMPSVYSDVLIFEIFNPSPKLLQFNSIDTNCSYSDDGSFSMILDREIPNGKKLVTSLFYEFIAGSNNYSLISQKDTTALINNGNGTHTYNWPSNTPILAGKYKVRYQTYDITTPNPVWDILEGTEDGFIIRNPPPITFSATTFNNVNCNGGSDGTIELMASGGVGNFKYELNNSGTWIPFSSSNTHNILALPIGTKTIKVQDGNECTQQN